MEEYSAKNDQNRVYLSTLNPSRLPADFLSPNTTDAAPPNAWEPNK